MLKTILVTGATGYLGSNLLRQMVASGEYETIIALKRKTSSLDRLADILPLIELYDVDDLPNLFAKHEVDAIVHTATSYGRKQETDLEIIDANFIFPLTLLNFCFAHNQGTLRKVINIDTVLAKQANQYALSKKQWADWLVFYANKIGFKTSNVLLHYMYGPSDDASKFTTHIIRQCLKNVAKIPLSDGRQEKDFIYIDDVVSGLITIIKHAQAVLFEDYELGTGVSKSVREYATITKMLTNSQSELCFGELPSRSKEEACMVANISKLAALNWQPKFDLSIGLGETINQELERS